MKTTNTIGTFLKKKRIENNLTQKDIAVRFELSSTQFISNWERGISLPPATYLPTLCQLLNIDPKILIKMILEKTEMELTSHFKSVVTNKDSRYGSE